MDKVNELLEKYGSDAIERMNTMLTDYEIENLQGTMKKNVEKGDNVSTLRVAMGFYGKYIDSGRKPNSRFPPPNIISNWCDRRNIGDGKTDKNGFNTATYPISRKIAIDGIKPRPFLHTFDDLMSKYEKRFQKALKDDVLKAL